MESTRFISPIVASNRAAILAWSQGHLQQRLLSTNPKWLSGVVIGFLVALLLAGCSSSNSGGTPPVPAGTAQVAAGYNHTVALKNEGTVWAWGDNGSGQLGIDITTLNSATPVQVSGLAGMTAVAAGEFHTVALKKDGTVWAWGDNSIGQLGNALTITQSSTPLKVSGLTGVIIAVAAGETHTVALKDDGTVWAWGNNGNGQLGDGTTDDSATPVPVSGLIGVKAIAAGAGHTVALKNDGTVWAWGFNGTGQLGDGFTTDSSTPVKVSGLTGLITAVAAGAGHTVALKSDGTVWAWGFNGNGQLGNGATTDSAVPVAISAFTGVTAVAAGFNHTEALKSDGTVWDWGDNRSGQLGNGIITLQSATPVQVSGLAGMTAIAAGAGHTVALKKNGTVWTWGLDNFGQLGNVDTTGSAAPAQVLGLTGITRVAAGNSHIVALAGGTVWAWGVNSNGQLGNGTTTNSIAPVPVSVLTGVFTAVAAGAGHSVALKSDGTVWAWGGNGNGQLGDGTTTNSTAPVPVSVLTGVTAIAAGAVHTVALKSDGTVWTWGGNSNGQLGIGNPPAQSTIPVPVSGLTGAFTAVAAGAFHTVALRNDGTVWTWGFNGTGQLGNGTTTNSTTPVQVSTLTGVTAVAAGTGLNTGYTVALKNDGTVWAWGSNGFGQLGNGTNNQSATPVPVSGLTGATAVAAGDDHTVALKNDFTVWDWGSNNTGQLGNGSNTDSNIPVPASSLTGGTSVAAGFGYTVALKNDGTVWAWGNNSGALLGIGWTQVQSLINLGAQ